MAMTIGELVGVVRADTSDWTRGLARAELAAEGFTVDASNRLRDMAGHFVSESSVAARALRSVENGLEDVSTQTSETTAVVEVETRTMAARFRALARAADGLGTSLGARLGRAVNGLRSMSIDTERLGSMAGRIGGVAMGFAKIGAAVGTAVPLVAGLVATMVQIAPAAAVAVSGFLALKLATGAVKLGMVGVGDAVQAALDPSDPAAFEEAIKNLAPSARAFAREVRTLQPELKSLQQTVQQEMFRGLDTVLRDMGKTTLPILKSQLKETAITLNFMAKGVGDAAIEMSRNGTLGKALTGANEGLANLSQAPGLVVRALGQIAASAAPSFARLTEAAGAGLNSLSSRLDKAFASNKMQQVIEDAITVFKQLFEVIGNVASILGSVFSAARTTGGDFLGVLTQITGAIAEAFASPVVQGALKAIYSTMAKLAETVGPLLVTALKAIAPIFVALGPPVQRVITMLGAALGPVLGALGPVLAMAAVAVGELLDAVSPLLPVIGSLVAQLLPALTPLLGLVANIFKALAPLVAQAAQILMSALQPVLSALIPVIQPIVDALLVLVQAILPILSGQAAELAPVIAQLAGMFAQLLVALAPVISQLILLIADILTKMTPILIPIIGLVAKLAEVFAGELGRVINAVVVPALQAIALLLKGDFSGAWAAAKVMVRGFIDYFVRVLIELPGRAGTALAGLAGALWGRVQEAGGRMNEAARQKRDEFVNWIRGIPAAARGALGDLSGYLWNSGASLIRGFIDGIKSQVGRVRDAASGVVSAARNFFPFSPAKEGPFSGKGWTLYSGRSLGEAFATGIASQNGLVGSAVESMMGAGALPGMALGSAGGGSAGGGGPTRIVVELAGPHEMRALIRGIVQKTGGTVETVFGAR